MKRSATPIKRSAMKRSRSTPVPMDIRRQVADRDKGRCRFCGTAVNVQAHHIVYRSQGGKDLVDNLISLCLEHHALVHSDKRTWMPLLLAALEFGRRGMTISVPQAQRWLASDHAPMTSKLLP